jgi:hypothetical protein
MTTANIGSSSTSQVPSVRTPIEPADIASQRPNCLGFWSAVLMAVFAAAAFALGLTTPPRSGPFCASSCVTYPYTNVAAFVPGDYLWLYPGIPPVLLFVVLMACIHFDAQGDKKRFSQIALSFAIIAAAVICTDYVIQLAVVQPSLLKGETEGLSLFSQYNPHGIFIALEDVGYVMMSVAFLFVGAVFVGGTRLERAIRWLFSISSLGAIGALIVLSLLYGPNLEYRFEVTVLTINWTMLIVSGALLSVWYRRAGRGNGGKGE